MRPRQDNHRDCVAEDSEETDQVDEYAINDEVRQAVSVDLLITLERPTVVAVVAAEVLRELANIVITEVDRRRVHFHRSVSQFSNHFVLVLHCSFRSRRPFTLPFSLWPALRPSLFILVFYLF